MRRATACNCREPDAGSTDHWTEKIDYLLAHPVPVVSFTFGTPSADVVERMHAVGTHVSVMVTDPDEAAAAAAVGADSLVVQGPDAGGHRGTHAVDKSPDTRELDQLLDDVQSVTALPLVAAGGISTPERVVELLARGAVAVQVGTALLLTPECGASAVHKDALRSRAYPGTTLHPGIFRPVRARAHQPVHPGPRPHGTGRLPGAQPAHPAPARGRGGRRRPGRGLAVGGGRIP